MRRQTAGLLLVCLLSWATTAFAGQFPRVTGTAPDSPACSKARSLATHMFKSTATHLYAPLSFPVGFDDRMLIGSGRLDISGGDALEPDPQDFQKETLGTGSGRENLYWGRGINGWRVVVIADPVGWRGDMYTLWVVKANVAREAFVAALRDPSRQAYRQPVAYQDWRPPLVFWSEKRGQAWLVTVNEPYSVLGDWVVYTVAAQGAHQDCTIEFRPQHRRILAALPKPVQRFEHLLEKAIGPGEEEGTLHPTLTLLLHVRRLLANMAFRPWAVSDADAYNTRERVDLGLVVWAEQGASYSRLYLQIQHAYAPAEHALAAFYERKYDMSPERAKRFAAKVTDILYRANFVFSTRD